MRNSSNASHRHSNGSACNMPVIQQSQYNSSPNVIPHEMNGIQHNQQQHQPQSQQQQHYNSKNTDDFPRLSSYQKYDDYKRISLIDKNETNPEEMHMAEKLVENAAQQQKSAFQFDSITPKRKKPSIVGSENRSSGINMDVVSSSINRKFARIVFICLSFFSNFY